ncbi:MAG: caspase family protein [Myxococcales bacterium]|nr:caspase family protein [Myxococcales bacterium]
MRSMIVGIRIKQNTTVTVSLTSSEVEATVRFARGNSQQFQPFAVSDGRGFRQALSPGDYIVIVDCDTSNRPVALTTDADVAFWSNDTAEDPPQWETWIGRVAQVSDDKDPWPKPSVVNAPPVDAFLASFLASGSAIADTMAQLRDRFAGKGASSGKPEESRRYALLIGIDKYNAGAGQDSTIYKDLHGCVYDVLAVEKLLRAKIPQIEVTLMIAPQPGGPGSDRQVPEDCLPTYRNIVAKWKALIAAARAKDIVYIHVSSHGGRTPTRFPAFKSARQLGKPGLDESIVPCDINDAERGRYLRDIEIALLLRQMAQRELITTLVLDSCHSGDATRGDQAQARRAEREDDRWRASDALPSDVGTKEELEQVAAEFANVPLGSAWRVDAELGRATSFNTVIAACRGTEVAYEYTPEGEGRCGALTHFWRRALENANDTTTYRQVYDQVFGKVRDVFANQSPMLMGEPERVVFSASIARQAPSVPVFAVNGTEVSLRAGAPLLSVGMHLALVPPDRLPELDNLAGLPEVEVIQVIDGFTSVARRIAGSGLDKGHELPIVVGAQGVVRSYPAVMQRHVRLPVQPNTPTGVLDRVADAIQTDTSKLLKRADVEGDYQVMVRGAFYEICDPVGVAIPNVPTVPVDEADAAPRVVDQLVRLARYSNVSAFENNDVSASLTGKLQLEQRSVRLPVQPEIPTEVLDRVAEAIQTDASKLLKRADVRGDYQVMVRDISYEICDPAGVAIPNVPTVPVNEADAARRVVDQLVHLARYRNVSEFENNDATASLTGKLHLEVLALPGYNPAAPDSFRPEKLGPGPATFEDGQYFCLRIRNDSSQDLQIALIDLQSNWAINTLVPDQPQLAPREVRELRLTARIPHQDPTVTTGWDLLKVLATKSTGDPVNYGLVNLPPLGKPYQLKGPRGEDASPLDRLIGILQEPEVASRTVEFAKTPSSGWTIAQKRIEIVRPGAG